MINKIKSFVRKHSFLRKILHVFHFKLFFYGLLYNHKAIRNIPFKYQLPDDGFIRLYPQGQIAKPLYTGGFEREEVRLFFAFLKPGMYIVDVGANIGLYSIIAKKKLKGEKGGKIWAFEPSTENYKRLLENLSLNKCNDLVIPLNMGLGNKDNEKVCLRRDTGYGDAERYILPEIKLPREKLPNIKKKWRKKKLN